MTKIVWDIMNLGKNISEYSASTYYGLDVMSMMGIAANDAVKMAQIKAITAQERPLVPSGNLVTLG
ncbi:MAG: hypothetical protein P8Q92_06530 [Pseudoprimorskyibacter sp.]|nr:hypothetical protein [Pseudoprimorskyibacter sp.]